MSATKTMSISQIIYGCSSHSAQKLKSGIILILFFCVLLSLPAQADTSEQPNPAAVFLSDIVGMGTGSQDNDYIKRLLIREVRARFLRLVVTPNEADFSLLVRVDGPHDGSEFETSYDESYTFHIELTDNDPNGFLLEHNIEYDTIETVEGFLPSLMHDILRYIDGHDGNYIVAPDTIPLYDDSMQTASTSTDWRDRHLYLGAYGFGSFISYLEMTSSPIFFFNTGGGVSIEWHILSFLSLEAGAEIAPVAFKYSETPYKDWVLDFPVMIKMLIELPHETAFGFYGGAKYSLSLMQTFTPSMLSWLAGLYGAVKLGPGELFIDPRFSMDLFPSKIVAQSAEFKRWTVQIGLGYKIGFFQKN